MIGGLDPAKLARADQEMADYRQGVEGLVATVREMLDEGIQPVVALSMTGIAFHQQSVNDPEEAKKIAFIAATALLRLAELPAVRS